VSTHLEQLAREDLGAFVVLYRDALRRDDAWHWTRWQVSYFVRVTLGGLLKWCARWVGMLYGPAWWRIAIANMHASVRLSASGWGYPAALAIARSAQYTHLINTYDVPSKLRITP